MAKTRNKRIVLDLIRTRCPISRTQLASVSGMNKATISGIVGEFIRRGIVREVGSGASAAGRKPVLLSFVADSAYVIGIVLNVDHARLVVTDLEAEVVCQRKEALRDTSAEAVLRQVAAMVERAEAECAGATGRIAAIGVGVPGFVDFESGVVIHTPNMNLSSINVKQYLEMRFHIPVFVDNSANVAAFGERLFGAGRHFEHFVYLSVSTGIGAGIVMNGELQRGAVGFAGELGHMIVEPHGLPCTCGGQGCLEVYGSLKALYRQVARALGEDPECYRPDILPAVVAAADSGERFAVEGLHAIGFYLGVGIAGIACAFNPQAVLVGNEIAVAEKWVMPVVETVVHTRCPRHVRDGLTLSMLPYSVNTTEVGAASLGVHGYLRRLAQPGDGARAKEVGTGDGAELAGAEAGGRFIGR